MIVIHTVKCSTIVFCGQAPPDGWHHNLYIEQIDRLLKIDDVVLQVDVSSEKAHWINISSASTLKYVVTYEVTVDTGPHPYR